MKAGYFLTVAIAFFIAIFNLATMAQEQRPPPSLPSYLMRDYDETGRELPPGVPKTVNTNGTLYYIPINFTTKLYQAAACKLVLQEANQVSGELQLPEKMPIAESNAWFFISPFGFNYAHRMIGSITTENYIYFVSRGNKFSCVARTHQAEDCRKYLAEGYAWPVSRIDTNAAYQLAAQWLSAVHMDVTGLNRDCRVSITPDSVYARAPAGKFIPTYWVAWIPNSNAHGNYRDVAAVRLFLPTRTLLELSMEDPKYILRPPVVFTNLAALFPGTAPIITNYPAPPIYISAPPP